jgi:hypothetical protein
MSILTALEPILASGRLLEDALEAYMFGRMPVADRRGDASLRSIEDGIRRNTMYATVFLLEQRCL